jgi:hypothetical protein
MQIVRAAAASPIMPLHIDFTLSDISDYFTNNVKFTTVSIQTVMVLHFI